MAIWLVIAIVAAVVAVVRAVVVVICSSFALTGCSAVSICGSVANASYQMCDDVG